MARFPTRKRSAERRADKRAKKAKRTTTRKAKRKAVLRPHLCLVRAPARNGRHSEMGREIQVATYNVHRWTGLNTRGRPDPARAGFVLSELGADVIALQEVLRPHGDEEALERLADDLGLHLAFAATRTHKFGQLGNAILSRWPLQSASTLDISHSRLERRSAVAARFSGKSHSVAVVATHLSLVDRTRHRQVQSLLAHPELASGPSILLGDMNAWRRCSASRRLDSELSAHHNQDWPASFPAVRPVLALDRIYARNASVVEIETHESDAARLASDHLPVMARIRLHD